MMIRTRRVFSILLLLVFLCTNALAYEDLTMGSKGEAVKAMQTRLMELGFYASSIDGAYGNQSNAAVKAFQAANGLEQTGVATADVLELLFSDAAKAAPPKPPVEVVSLQKKGASLRITFKNNSTDTIAEIGYTFLEYLSNGNLLSDRSRRIENIPEESFSLQYTDHMTLKPGGTISKTYIYEDVSPISADVVYGGVYNFTTTDGKSTRYTLDMIRFTGTDGSSLAPLDENAPKSLTDEESKKLDDFFWGINDSCTVYKRIAADYSTIAGVHVFEISPDSLMEHAGIRKGDIITAYDDQPATEQHASSFAKLRVLAGETVILHYRRNNTDHTTEIYLDMEAPPAEQPSSAAAESAVSIIDELMRCGDLLERGLITQEEYDLIKQKLLSGE